MSDAVKPARPPFAVIAVTIPPALALAQVAYLYILNRTDLGLGFPIDDAYIFQRYAVNLADGNGFSFNPGEISFGCTSILWPILMALLTKAFYFLDYITLAFWVGGNLFALASFLAGWIVLRATSRSSLALLAGLLIAGSPPLCMNAVSGMETPLTLALLMLLAAFATAPKPRPIAAGLMAGLLGITRPEGLYFLPGAVLAWLILRFYKDRDRRVPLLDLVKFAIVWAWLTVPAYAVIYSRTGSFLPTTFLGKIMSTNPATLDRALSNRIFLAALSLGDGWLRLAAPLRALAIVMVVGVAAEIIFTLVRVRRSSTPAWTLMGTLILAGYLLLPLTYGLSFPVGPAFGGYYYRYIAPVLAVAVVLGLAGIHTLAEAGLVAGASRPWWLRAATALVRTAGAGLMIAYLGWLYQFQAEDAQRVFRAEVALNTGLRMTAARWLADPSNTPPDARIMVGYTGLGVIGMNCHRYVLDIGALINPDIFEYYRRATLAPDAKWAKQVAYMRDRGLTYYVTFAIPREYRDKIAEPAQTPGFTEAARFGDYHDPPLAPYDQVRIYKINWRKWNEAMRPGDRRDAIRPGP